MKLKFWSVSYLAMFIWLLVTVYYGAQYLGQTHIFHEEWHDPTINKGAQFETVP